MRRFQSLGYSKSGSRYCHSARSGPPVIPSMEVDGYLICGSNCLHSALETILLLQKIKLLFMGRGMRFREGVYVRVASSPESTKGKSQLI
jgi:hypothetical protein